MISRFLIVLTAVLLIAVVPVSAQRNKRTTKVVKSPEEELYDELLLSTARVLFIDSIVVDKATFLDSLFLPPEVGTLTRDNGTTVYTNEFGDTRLLATGDSITGRRLSLCYRYGQQWDAPRLLSEIDNPCADYPFLMADGVTLYFSAEGPGTVGGRDIFRTVYNSEDFSFYEATNVGLPYNSPYNDYLLAISDIDNIGWLVSDRYQPADKVCIYTFVPTAQRETFPDDMPPQTLADYAALRSVPATWAFGDYASAASRLAAIEERRTAPTAEEGITFVVNDDVVYTSPAAFSSSSNRAHYTELVAQQHKAAQLATLLSSLRHSYATASTLAKQREIGRKILALEQEVEALEASLAADEKALRNSENKNISR